MWRYVMRETGTCVFSRGTAQDRKIKHTLGWNIC
jgi:hypothetical protein